MPTFSHVRCGSNSNSFSLFKERNFPTPLISPGNSDGHPKHNSHRVGSVSGASVGHLPPLALDEQASIISNWASRHPGLHSLRQRLFSTVKPRCSVHSSSFYQPPFPAPRTYADVLKTGVLPGDFPSSSSRPGVMANDGSDAAGWRVVDHRRQQVRGRPSWSWQWVFPRSG